MDVRRVNTEVRLVDFHPLQSLLEPNYFLMSIVLKKSLLKFHNSLMPRWLLQFDPSFVRKTFDRHIDWCSHDTTILSTVFLIRHRSNVCRANSFWPKVVDPSRCELNGKQVNHPNFFFKTSLHRRRLRRRRRRKRRPNVLRTVDDDRRHRRPYRLQRVENYVVVHGYRRRPRTGTSVIKLLRRQLSVSDIS